MIAYSGVAQLAISWHLWANKMSNEQWIKNTPLVNKCCHRIALDVTPCKLLGIDENDHSYHDLAKRLSATLLSKP